jgi:hypothetical protein
MPEIYDSAAKSQCANQIWSNGRNHHSIADYSTSAGGQRAAKKWQPSDSVLKFNVLNLLHA